MTDTPAQREARRATDRHRHQVGLQRKKDRQIMVVVHQVLADYEHGRGATACMDAIRKAARE